jgi:hypothetical protein
MAANNPLDPLMYLQHCLTNLLPGGTHAHLAAPYPWDALLDVIPPPDAVSVAVTKRRSISTPLAHAIPEASEDGSVLEGGRKGTWVPTAASTLGTLEAPTRYSARGVCVCACVCVCVFGSNA